MQFRFPPSRWAGTKLAALALAAAVGVAAAAATVLYVSVDRLDVVDKKRAVAATVATVDRNTPLNVVAKEGRWYKVEVGGKQGYVAETVVATSPQGNKGEKAVLSGTGGGSNPRLETAAAVKGVNEGAQQYASRKGYKTDGLRTLQQRREAIKPADFEAFLNEGGFGGRTASARPVNSSGTAVAAK